MGILGRTRRETRKPLVLGRKFEPGREPLSREERKNFAAKIGIFLLLLLLTMAVFPRWQTYEYAVEVGDVWRSSDLIAPFDFPVFKSDVQIEEERQQIRFEVPPVFVRVPDALRRMESRIDSLSTYLRHTFNAYASWQLHQSRGQTQEAASDSARYFQLRRAAPFNATPRQWDLMLSSYLAGVSGIDTPSRAPSETTLDEVLLHRALEIGAQQIPFGVLNIPKDSILTEQITILNERERTELVLPVTSVMGLNEIYAFGHARFREHFLTRPDTIALGLSLFRTVFEPSLVMQEEETFARWREREQRISPTRGMIHEGQILVERGDVVTEEVKARLNSLARMRAERSGNLLTWKIATGQFLLTFATFLIFFLYLYLLRRPIFDSNRHVLLIAILFAFIITLFAVAVRLPFQADYAVPVAIGAILLTVTFDSRVGMFGTLTLALLGTLLFGYDFEFTFATVFAGAIAVFSVRDVKNRAQFFITAGLVFAAYVMVLLAFSLLRYTSLDQLMMTITLVGVNSFLLLLAYPLIWAFERVFGITTDVTLLEMSDTNRPLLKELSMRAPGTFNHSLQVANLAETASNAIGANALLARVGALYHDIGKMLKPEYFIENLRPDENPHARLKPHMSALIIASHVKEGVDLGRQYRLPQVVLDFILTHHGTTRMEYFYRLAMDEQDEEEPVSESEFRYPGPRPTSKETGVLMLADSVEAASRSIEKPTPQRLEALIDSIFQARIDDGQLDHCPLTFSELREIRETFLSVLSGIYHFRVKYPGQAAEAEQEAVGAASEALPAALQDTASGELLQEPPSDADRDKQPEHPESTDHEEKAEEASPARDTSSRRNVEVHKIDDADQSDEGGEEDANGEAPRSAEERASTR